DPSHNRLPPPLDGRHFIMHCATATIFAIYEPYREYQFCQGVRRRCLPEGLRLLNVRTRCIDRGCGNRWTCGRHRVAPVGIYFTHLRAGGEAARTRLRVAAGTERHFGAEANRPCGTGDRRGIADYGRRNSPCGWPATPSLRCIEGARDVTRTSCGRFAACTAWC